MADQQKEGTQQIKINIQEIHTVMKMMEQLIKRKALTEEEVREVYSSWSSVIRFCEDVQRKSEIENLYKKEEAEAEKSTQEQVKEQLE